jgi:2-polyprenyl-3-methyl-5-hydroxy-6-metoxy-1,4-benzoquinol methylase
VVWATLQNVAHRSGVRYQRRFEPRHEGNVHYDLKLGYASSHTYALDAVPAGARVLDIGSGPGGLAGELLKKGCQVTLVDQYPAQVDGGDVQVVVQNLDDDVAFDSSDQDVLLLLDVIEHLRDPERFLEQLRRQFGYEPKRLILTTPNVAFVLVRMMLALGQFNYGKAGILDRTHTRLFTFRTLRRLLTDEGFRIKSIRGVPAPFPKVLGKGVLGKLAISSNLALIRLSRTLFSYQIYVEAESTPDVSFVLADARRRSTRPLAGSATARNDEQPKRSRGAQVDPWLLLHSAELMLRALSCGGIQAFLYGRPDTGIDRQRLAAEVREKFLHEALHPHMG